MHISVVDLHPYARTSSFRCLRLLKTCFKPPALTRRFSKKASGILLTLISSSLQGLMVAYRGNQLDPATTETKASFKALS